MRRPSSPLAACGALLVAIGAGALAARHRTLRPSTEPAPLEGPAPSSSGPIDLNRATVEELERLPRIGPALAARIVETREALGGFSSVDDLDRVRGIGRATLEAIRPLVVVSSVHEPVR